MKPLTFWDCIFWYDYILAGLFLVNLYMLLACLFEKGDSNG